MLVFVSVVSYTGTHTHTAGNTETRSGGRLLWAWRVAWASPRPPDCTQQSQEQREGVAESGRAQRPRPTPTHTFF